MTFVVDIIAMVFGMPRALFPQMAQETFGGPPGGGLALGMLNAGLAIGSLLGGLTGGWIHRIYRQGVAIVAAILRLGPVDGVVRHTSVLWLAVLYLAIGGWSDLVSAVYRSTILQVDGHRRDARPDAGGVHRRGRRRSAGGRPGARGGRRRHVDGVRGDRGRDRHDRADRRRRAAGPVAVESTTPGAATRSRPDPGLDQRTPGVAAGTRTVQDVPMTSPARPPAGSSRSAAAPRSPGSARSRPCSGSSAWTACTSPRPGTTPGFRRWAAA